MNTNNERKGFTLIELMIVIVIISILATLIIPNLLSAKAKAQEATTRAEISTLTTALTVYERDRGSYPPTIRSDSSAILVYCLDEEPVFTPSGPIDGTDLPPRPKKQYFTFKRRRIDSQLGYQYISLLGFPYFYRDYYSYVYQDGKPNSAKAEEVANKDGFDIWTASSKTPDKPAGLRTNPQLLRDNPVKNRIICNWN